MNFDNWYCPRCGRYYGNCHCERGENEKVYAYITADAGDIIPDGQIGEWFDQWEHDPLHDEYRVLRNGEVRIYKGMTMREVAALIAGGVTFE